MIKNNGKNKHKSAIMRWLILLVVLLTTLLVSSVFAQDELPEGDLEFLTADGPESVSAPAGETWIPATRDTFVASNTPNSNYGFDTFIRFGQVPGGLGATRPLIYFNLQPYIPSQANIVKAELHIYLAAITPSGDSGRGYAANYLAQSWDEGAVTWNNMPQWGAQFAQGTLPSTGGWHVTNVTSLVSEWQSNPGGNNGVILIGDERPDQNFERAYYSKDAGNGLYPRLYVQFDESSDDTAPVANVTAPTPPGVWSPADFTVKWQGSDPNNPDGSAGSGIRWYDVYYSKDDGYTWIIGRAQVTTTETQAVGAEHLKRYDFYARARDNAGNEGPAPSGPGSSQTWTRIDAVPPSATVNPLPEYTASSSFQVSWTETREGSESGLKYYDVQWRVDGGPWNIFVYNTTATAATFTLGENGRLYEFRAIGVDNVGNAQPWEGPQAETTVFLDPIAYIVPFNPNVYQKLDGPEAGDGFTVSWEAVTPPGVAVQSFDVRYQRPGNTTWLSWLTDTQQTAAFFELAQDDPDGTYVFQVRAKDTNGNVGQYLPDAEGFMTVDRLAPFITPRIVMPFVAYGD